MAVTITAQAGGDTISGQVRMIGLAADRWRHELRNVHGEWTRNAARAVANSDPSGWGVFKHDAEPSVQLKYGYLAPGEDKQYPEHEFNVGQLIPTQRHDKSESAAWGEPGDPFVVTIGDKHYLLDGHHRAAKAGAGGRIVAQHLDLDFPEDRFGNPVHVGDMSYSWDGLASRVELASRSRLIDLVGPKGYVHNWIFVGVPLHGDRVYHPHLGTGVVTGYGSGPARTDNFVTVKFDRSGAKHHFEVRRTPGTPGFKPRTGPDPARAAVHDYTMKGASFVEDTLGGHSAWNGITKLWPKEANPGTAAFMHWNGDMSFQREAAHYIARNTGDGPGADVGHVYYMQTPLHELIHSVIPEGESYHDSQLAYQFPEVAAIEEGFTQLATSYHAEEFFKAQGLDKRPTMFYTPGGHKTLGELARERASPAAIARNKSWGAYPKETAAALAWTREVAKAEGLPNDLRSKKVQKRLRELADEVNAASPKGKPEVMASQMMRAMGVADRPRMSGYDLSGEVAQIMRRKLAKDGSMAGAASEARSYLDSFTWNVTHTTGSAA